MSEPKATFVIGGTRITCSIEDAVKGRETIAKTLEHMKVKCGACGRQTLPTTKCTFCGTTRSP